MLLNISSILYPIPICLFFINILTIHLLISLGTSLAHKNIEGDLIFFKFGRQISLGGLLMNLLFV